MRVALDLALGFALLGSVGFLMFQVAMFAVDTWRRREQRRAAEVVHAHLLGIGGRVTKDRIDENGVRVIERFDMTEFSYLSPPCEAFALRNRPTNAQAEPSYPGLETVVMSIRHPLMTVHQKSERCALEAPHEVAACGEFNPIAGRIPFVRADARGDIAIGECLQLEARLLDGEGSITEPRGILNWAP